VNAAGKAFKDRTSNKMIDGPEGDYPVRVAPCSIPALMLEPIQRPLLRAPRPSAVEWAAATVGVCLVYRYRWILDDSCVYFRYVDNLLFLRRGLVYNVGEYVEGYSSPAWVLLLVAMRATRLDFWSITLAFGVGSFCAFAYACVVINRKLMSTRTAPALDLPLVYIATSYAVTSYFTSGSECALVHLAAAGIALYCLEPQTRWLEVALGALPLVRNELALPLFATGLVGWQATRRVPWRLVASAGVCGAGWLVFRVVYYADLFPSPFYLKDEVSPLRGLYYVVNTFGPEHFLFFVAPALAAGALAARGGREALRLPPRVRMVAVALSAIPYVVKVGGDMMHYRLLALPFCLLALSLGGLLESGLASPAARAPRWAGNALCALAGAGYFAFYPGFLSSHPVLRREERELDHGISDAPWHRHHPTLTFDAPRWAEDRARLAEYRRWGGTHEGVSSDVFCGAIYVDFRTRYVHGYGLTEPVLARVDAPEARPGHKEPLRRLARDLVQIRRVLPETHPGVAATAIARGIAPPWVIANASSIALVESRMYNSHGFFTNLASALHPIARMRLPSEARISDNAPSGSPVAR
jgi:hypothetical protein